MPVGGGSSAVEVLLAVDAGTGSGRCVAFDRTGRMIASASRRLSYRAIDDPVLPRVRGFDLDPGEFWGALAACTREVMAALGPTAVVRAVVPTSQREGCVLLGRDDEVLYAGPNLDARSIVEGLELESRLGAARLHTITGHAPPYIFPLARWRWFVAHGDPGRVASLLMLNDWIVRRLSGERWAEHASASESMLYDVRARGWSAELVEAAELPRSVLPPLADAGAPAGRVTDAAAAETSIPAGTPVFVGGPDTQLALLGSGVLRDGDAGVVLGTTSPVQLVCDAPVLDPAATLWTSAHVVPGAWVLESNCGDTGSAYRWLLELFFGAADAAAHAAADAAVAAVPPEPRELLTHLGPVVFNLREMNPFSTAGILFRFPLHHVDRPTRGEILRAFLESVAYAVRGNVEQIEAVRGRPVERVRLSGGMTRVRALPDLVATVLGRPVEVVATAESASLGCAILGAVATGAHASLDAAVAAMVGTRPVEPDLGRHDAFGARYRLWRAKVDELVKATI
jgi:sugar (pentulose or hexulose) kinase